MAAARPLFCLLPVLLLSMSMAATNDIDVTVIPEKPIVNNTAILNVNGIRGKIQFSAWYKGSNSEAKNQILTYDSAGREIPGGQYFAEASALSNGSLKIINLQKAFSGNYTVSLHDEVRLHEKTVYLQVNDETSGDASGGLSPGAIIGICIGSAAAVLLAGIAIYFGIRKGSEGPL